MHSIICFGSFLLLLNLLPYLWFIIYSDDINGYKNAFPFLAIITAILFVSYIICFVLYCYCMYENIKSVNSEDKAGHLWSLITLFITLLFINIYYYIAAINAGQGSLIVMVAVVPISVLVFVSYLLYALFYFVVLEVIKGVKKNCCNVANEDKHNENKKTESRQDEPKHSDNLNIASNNNDSKQTAIEEIKWWQNLILVLICWGIPYFVLLCSCFHLNIIDMNNSILVIGFLLIIWLVCISFLFTSKVKNSRYMKIKKYFELIIAIIFVLLLIYKYLQTIYVV